jgi:hypothetical protein
MDIKDDGVPSVIALSGGELVSHLLTKKTESYDSRNIG